MPAVFQKIATMTRDNGAVYNNPTNWWEYLDEREVTIADDVMKLHPKSQPSGRLVRMVGDTHKAMLAYRRKTKKQLRRLVPPLLNLPAQLSLLPVRRLACLCMKWNRLLLKSRFGSPPMTVI